ncbi:MAG: biotin transporter BioY [Pseudomonadota bacterium]
MNFLSTHPPIFAVLWPDNNLVRNIVLALAGSVLLAIAAKVQIPLAPASLFPVPVTMQTFVVLSLGAAYGWRLAAATLLLYLSEGAIGLPVFAEGGGMAYLLGPTAGYLFGFLVAAIAMGWLAERGVDRSPAKMFPAMLFGNFLIYVLGLIWLASFIGMDKAVVAGLQPFVFGDLLKCALAAILFPVAWKFVSKNSNG